MKVLALDPGAKRCGWAILSEGGEGPGGIQYHASGISGLAATSNYQEHRLSLIGHWVDRSVELFDTYIPTLVVSEVMPPTGGSVPSIINRQLGLTVVSTIQAMAVYHGHRIEQIAASSVKKKIGGVGKASKVKVRDGVLKLLPELESRRPEWTGKDAVWDEVDALAVGLARLIE